jgi:hypothetical protein
MPLELESGQLQLTLDEQANLQAAGALVSRELGRTVDLARPLTLNDYADLLAAKCVVERDLDTLKQIVSLIADQIARRKSAQ